MRVGLGKVAQVALFVGALGALLVAPLLVAPTTVDAATLPADHAQLVAKVVELTNKERTNRGLKALVVHSALTRAAQDYAAVLADGSCFGHSCGSTLSQRLDRAGYTNRRAWGENIAWGYTTPEAVVAGWMASDGHRRNILNSVYKEVGVGLAKRSSGRLYWVEVFGARS
jgi:uncharacterized protein YkwD